MSQFTTAAASRVFEIVVVGILAALIAFQLFVPPIVGMADNGDYAKVAARLCMQPPPPMLHSDDRYWKFSYTEYEVAPQHCLAWWQWSSMSIFAWMAKQVHDIGHVESHFDIRVLGGVCAVVWLTCFWRVLRSLAAAPRLVRVVAAALAIAVGTDVLYVAYFHSFYGDCAAMIFLFVTCVVAWKAASEGGWKWPLAFGVSGTLLAWSKGPHVLIAPWLVGFAMYWWWRNRLHGWLVSALMVVVASAASLTAVPEGYGSGTTFNVIFARLLPTAKDPARLLAAFDLPPEAAAFSGEYVYKPTAPYNDPAWRARFSASLTPQRLALFYLRTPAAALKNLSRDLDESATMRLFAYYRRKGRTRPDVPARSLLGWSDLRSWLIRNAPWHLPLFYAAIAAAGLIVLGRATQNWQRIGASLVLALAGAGVTEFVITSLFDALETQRHLFIFHTLTDVIVVHASLGLAWVVSQRVRRTS